MCLFLIESDEVHSPIKYGFKVFPCNSNYRNKKFEFEYLTILSESEPELHTFFKLKAKGENIRRQTWREGSICLVNEERYTGSSLTHWPPFIASCSCPSPNNEIFACIGMETFIRPKSSFGFFKFEPVEEQ